MGEFEDYKIFFEEAPLALFRTDLETGKFLMANNFAATLLGCDSVKELLENKKASDYYPWVVRNRLLRLLKNTGSLQGYELELTLPNRSRIYVRASLRINCGGSCIECFLTDITELVSLRTSQKLMAAAIDSRIAAFDEADAKLEDECVNCPEHSGTQPT